MNNIAQVYPGIWGLVGGGVRLLKYRSWGPPTRVLDFVDLSRQKIIQPAAAEISPKVLRGASRCDDTPNPTTKYRPNPSPQLVWAPLYAPALPRGPPLHHLNCGSSVSTKKVFLSTFWAGLRLVPEEHKPTANTQRSSKRGRLREIEELTATTLGISFS